MLALPPGLALVGAGMGLGITPLATLIMAADKPEHLGATSGVLSTTQNVGNAIGVAVLGVLFYGAESPGSRARSSRARSRWRWPSRASRRSPG